MTNPYTLALIAAALGDFEPSLSPSRGEPNKVGRPNAKTNPRKKKQKQRKQARKKARKK